MSLPLELLIAAACISGDGCTEATKAYYAAKPQLRVLIRANRRSLERAVGRELMWSIPVAYNTLIRQRLNVRINKSLNLTFEREQSMLNYSYTF